MVIEVTTFRLAAHADETAFLAADRRVQTQFMATLGGFRRRTTARGTAGEWLVIVLWNSASDADAAAEDAREHFGRHGVLVARRRRQSGAAPLQHPRLTAPSDGARPHPSGPTGAAGYCWTSITGLPSGSTMAASVGPPGTSKGSATTVPPSSSARAREAARSRTWT